MANTPAAPTLTSRGACLEAAYRYSALFQRYDPADFEAGFEQAYDAGLRWLHSRAAAEEWVLPDETVGRMDELFRYVDRLMGDEVDEWLEQFPRVFLELLDRRCVRLQLEHPGRRFTDRFEAPTPRSGRGAPVSAGSG